MEEDWDIDNKQLEEDYLDEDIQIRPENTHSNGETALERINKHQVDEQIASGERQESYPVWKILLVVGGSAVGLVNILIYP